MNESASPSKTRRVVGSLLLLTGLLVFAIRLQHAGPYAPPEEGNLRAALLALLLGIAWLLPWRLAPAASQAAATLLAVLSAVVLFFALYATLAELEEVVVLRADHGETRGKDLRLWIVDYEGVPWVTMPASKAKQNRLAGARAELLRDGQRSCVVPRRFDDRESVDRIFEIRYEKYAIQRLATAIGLFSRSAGDAAVTLRLEPCPTP